jgi:hypothetical protein
MNDHASPQGEPTLADVTTEFPRWHTWKGISGLVYASRNLTSPPAVVRGEDPADLRDQIRGWEGNHTGQGQG